MKLIAVNLNHRPSALIGYDAVKISHLPAHHPLTKVLVDCKQTGFLFFSHLNREYPEESNRPSLNDN